MASGERVRQRVVEIQRRGSRGITRARKKYGGKKAIERRTRREGKGGDGWR